MDNKYGRRLRKDMRKRRKRKTCPPKFKGKDAMEIEHELCKMAHRNLSLRDFAHLFA